MLGEAEETKLRKGWRRAGEEEMRSETVKSKRKNSARRAGP